jgi:tRNA(Ile)-lysidine synthase
MQIEIPAGKYVVAVSGGVDSTVLLDLLRLYPGVKLVVAHYDHGIRQDSAEDRLFVQGLARRHRLPYVYDRGRLGAGASEAEARKARYTFLRKVQQASGSSALVTAHHQDDVLETAVINLLRGTGRKGLSSLTSGEGIIRPLLEVPKNEIIDYAKRHGLQWHEDSTNSSDDYVRNHVRHNILPGWSPEAKARLLQISRHMQSVNQEVDGLLDSQVQGKLDREWFILLPHNVTKEVLAAWLRLHNIADFDRKTLERLAVAGKVAEPGKSVDVVKGHVMKVGRDFLALDLVER